MSEKKNSLEEKRILQKKLAMVYAGSGGWGSLTRRKWRQCWSVWMSWNRCRKKEDGADFSEPKEALKRFYQKYAGENVEN